VSEKTIPSLSPEERRAALALTLVADVGSVKFRQLMDRFVSATRALEQGFSKDVVCDAYANADAALARATSRGLELTVAGDERYPSQLLELHDPPAVLWSAGNWRSLNRPIVAIVGTRRATAYGLRITRALASGLAGAGACIVSGMALGIDAAAHIAALEAGGDTVAVLGTGADVAYPRAHVALHREIASRALVLSELPPGAHSSAGSFPRRNRIIAALAALTIVVEAPMKSGALITSRHALELGRDVAAVPGPIDAPQSAGTNDLLREGAHVITSVADAVMLLGLDRPVTKPQSFDDPTEDAIWRALTESAVSIDELCARAALPVAHCLTALTHLELRGVVECALTGEIRRR